MYNDNQPSGSLKFCAT